MIALHHHCLAQHREKGSGRQSRQGGRVAEELQLIQVPPAVASAVAPMQHSLNRVAKMVVLISMVSHGCPPCQRVSAGPASLASLFVLDHRASNQSLR